MKVKTIQSHPYKGIPRAVGDEYDMDDQDVFVMVAYGNVIKLEPMREPQFVAQKKYKRRDMQAS